MATALSESSSAAWRKAAAFALSWNCRWACSVSSPLSNIFPASASSLRDIASGRNKVAFAFAARWARTSLAIRHTICLLSIDRGRGKRGLAQSLKLGETFGEKTNGFREFDVLSTELCVLAAEPVALGAEDTQGHVRHPCQATDRSG